MINDSLIYKVPGWFHSRALYTEVVNTFNSGAHFVEVGSFLGQSSVYMCENILKSKKIIKFDCIDLWDSMFADSIHVNNFSFKNQQMTNYYNYLISKYGDHQPLEALKHTLKNYNYIDIVQLIKSSSKKASNSYQNNSLDFVYLDADHSYNSVIEDLNLWYPKVKPDGIIAGDDFHMPEVKNAVIDFFGSVEDKSDKEFLDMTWMKLKNIKS